MHNCPEYYSRHAFECLEEMRLMFGTDAVITFCKLNVWKYRYREGAKPNTDDAKKADAYLEYINRLQERKCYHD